MRWINQNPFKSIFWAVQGMAAELSTGALLMSKIKETGKDVSMLVVHNHSSFFKKAKGKVQFECTEGIKIEEVLKTVIATKEGQTLVLNSVGTNEDNIIVSTFKFEWSLKVRTKEDK